MADLIDRDWVMKRMVFEPDYEVVKMAPAVEAVPVVRCKDCVLWNRISPKAGKCPFLIGEHQCTREDHYCSCGEARKK